MTETRRSQTDAPPAAPGDDAARPLDAYVGQLEEIFQNIEGMLSCKDLDSLARQTTRVHQFLLKMAVTSLGAVAAELRERQAVDEALPRRAIYLDEAGRDPEVVADAAAVLRAHDPLGEEVREPWCSAMGLLESEGFKPVRVGPRAWMPRPFHEGDLSAATESFFAEVHSVALLPFLLRDHRPGDAERERMAGVMVVYLRQRRDEDVELIRRSLRRMRVVGEVVLTNRVSMEGLLKKVATFRHQAKGKSLEMQGPSAAVRELKAAVEAAARDDRRLVRMQGPRGAGKKHVAERFHRLSPGRGNPFVAVDCGAVAARADRGTPGDYAFRQRLFGDIQAADLEEAMGAIEQARGGTLFLDGVEHLPLSFQYKLAQVLQDGTFTRLGEEGTVVLDCRIILASEADLEARAAGRKFSSKLLRPFRDQPRLVVPGLNERREDIPALAEAFFARQVRSQKRHRLRSLAPETVEALTHRDWSDGNVKALMNLMGWAVASCGPEDTRLEPRHLPVPRERGA